MNKSGMGKAENVETTAGSAMKSSGMGRSMSNTPSMGGSTSMTNTGEESTPTLPGMGKPIASASRGGKKGVRSSGGAMGMRASGRGAPSSGMGGGGSNGGSKTTEPPTRRTCGTMNVHYRLLAKSEEYRRARAQIENHTLQHTRGIRAQAARTGVTRVPVVVHVVWNTNNENISDAQIQSQIDVLNRDYRALNPDISIVPAVFQPLIADCRVEFYLATTDPNGAATNGITRDQTTTTSFTDDDKVKSVATGGADPWPSDRYLNVWVCLLSGGLLGYAQFPGGPAATDGVVITHTGFGTNGTAAAPFNLGRTATHEIGHWLNLLHIWGDDGTGCSGSDQVDDTPNQAGPNFGVPTFPHVTCSNGPNGDLFMDYMDYVDDAAMVMFTQGQLARVDACLDGPRVSFETNQRLNAPSGPVVSWGSNRLDAFVLGTDSALYHKWWDGANWGPAVQGYEYMGGICSSPPEVVSWGSNRLDAFVLGTDSALYHKWWDGANWGPSVTDYEYMGGICASPPKIAAWDTNRLDVFVLGTDHAVYHKWWDGANWGPSITDYEYMGGICMTQPEVVAWGPNRLDLFVIGTDHALYHKWWDGANWGPSVTGWENLGGVIEGRPRVVSWGQNRLDIFVIGTDHALYHKWWDGANWGPSLTDYEYMGGIILGTPEAVSWSENRLDVFVRGTDSAIYHKWWDGANWGPSITDYEYMGGVCSSAPDAVAWGPNRLDLFVTGEDSALYHKWWDGANWGPSVTGWEYMGGIITEFAERPAPSKAAAAA